MHVLLAHRVRIGNEDIGALLEQIIEDTTMLVCALSFVDQMLELQTTYLGLAVWASE